MTPFDVDLLALMSKYQADTIASRVGGPWRPGLRAPIDFSLHTLRSLLPPHHQEVMTEKRLRAAARRIVAAGHAHEVTICTRSHWRLGAAR